MKRMIYHGIFAFYMIGVGYFLTGYWFGPSWVQRLLPPAFILSAIVKSWIDHTDNVGSFMGRLLNDKLTESDDMALTKSVLSGYLASGIVSSICAVLIVLNRTIPSAHFVGNSVWAMLSCFLWAAILAFLLLPANRSHSNTKKQIKHAALFILANQTLYLSAVWIWMDR